MQHEQTEDKLSLALEFVRSVSESEASVAIVLGSGLGGLADVIESPAAIAYDQIPGFRRASAGGHRGQLILGDLEGVRVVAMAGRLHRYEGWTNDDIAFPIQLMAAMGASRLIVSNAAGGVSPKLQVGDIVVIRDHINWMGGRFSWNRDADFHCPVRSGEVYDSEMSQLAVDVGVRENFNAVPGTYLATLGPTYETRSEYRMMRKLGADVAGMSTVPEVLAASRLQLRVLGLSMVSNVANPDVAVVANHEEVLAAGQAAAVKMEEIVRAVLRSM